MFVYATLLTSDSYLPGALVLANSIQRSNTAYQTVCYVTPQTVSQSVIGILYNHFDHVVIVNVIRSEEYDNLALLGRRELDVTFTKIHVFNPTLLEPIEAKIGEPIERLAFMDADTLVLHNIDDIFDFVEEEDVLFAAAPDVGWPDCFNSGVFVTKPRKELYDQIKQHMHQVGSFDGGDQGLLNSFFYTYSTTSYPAASAFSGRTARLPFVYNTTPSTTYSYLPAYEHFKQNIKVVHFIGEGKPWKYDRFQNGGAVPRGDTHATVLALINEWWNVYDESDIATALSSVRGQNFTGWNFGAPNYPQQEQAQETEQAPNPMAYTNFTSIVSSTPPTSESEPKPAAPPSPPRPSPTVVEFVNYRIEWPEHELNQRHRRASVGREKIRTIPLPGDEEEAAAVERPVTPPPESQKAISNGTTSEKEKEKAKEKVKTPEKKSPKKDKEAKKEKEKKEKEAKKEKEKKEKELKEKKKLEAKSETKLAEGSPSASPKTSRSRISNLFTLKKKTGSKDEVGSGTERSSTSSVTGSNSDLEKPKVVAGMVGVAEPKPEKKKSGGILSGSGLKLNKNTTSATASDPKLSKSSGSVSASDSKLNKSTSSLSSTGSRSSSTASKSAEDLTGTKEKKKKSFLGGIFKRGAKEGSKETKKTTKS